MCAAPGEGRAGFRAIGDRVEDRQLTPDPPCIRDTGRCIEATEARDGGPLRRPRRVRVRLGSEDGNEKVLARLSARARWHWDR